MSESRALYDVWAPPEGVWSAWAKPVLFAHFDGRVIAEVAPPEILLAWRPDDLAPCALVVALAGVDSVALGLDLADAGFRPVPVFNACPAPPGRIEVVPVSPILAALALGAGRLAGASLPADAPPAFLVDADRQGPPGSVGVNRFDNRSVHFATDFPSAAALQAHGLDRVVVIHDRPIGDDLADVLRNWRRDGLEIFAADRRRAETPRPLALPPAALGALSQFARRLWALVTLRRNRLGGYGAFIPEASSSSSGAFG